MPSACQTGTIVFRRGAGVLLHAGRIRAVIEAAPTAQSAGMGRAQGGIGDAASQGPNEFRREQELNSTTEQKVPEDVSDRASRMPRNAALLYRNKTPKDPTSPHYRGLLRLEDGQVFWIGLWVRSVNGERALEIRLVPKT